MTPQEKLKDCEDSHVSDIPEGRWLINRVKQLEQALHYFQLRYSCPKCRKNSDICRKALVGG